MAFVVTAITPIPVNPDSSFAAPAWGEVAGTFARPAVADPGYINGQTVDEAEINYAWQHGARWTRAAAINRMVHTNEGFFCSCVVTPDYESGFNVGGGTLDITLAPTRIVVDVDSDGGTVIEVKATLGSPQTLPANSKHYVSFDEAGSVTVTSVGLIAPEPPPPAGEVFIWVLETDGVELVDVDTYTDVPSFPCLGPLVGLAAAFVTSLTVPDGGTINVGTGITFDVKEWACEYLQLVDGAPLPNAQGRIVNSGTWLAVADAAGARQRSLSDPRRGYAEGAGPFGGTTTVATTQRTVAVGEVVDITIMAGYEMSNASSLVVEIEVIGPGGSATVLAEGIPTPATTYSTMSLPKQTTPSVDTGTVDNPAVYTFNFKIGALAGTVTSSHARVEVNPGFQT
jgi:hypothetical protein